MIFSGLAALARVFRLSGTGPGAVRKILEKLARERTPLRLEVENTDINFFTILDLRREKVMLPRPTGLKAKLAPGTGVRFDLPNDRGRALRLVVDVGNFQMTRGGPVLLCEIPRHFAPPSKRSAVRFNTSRFRNLYLVLPQKRKALRIIDVSEHGCKVFHGAAGEPGWLTAGEAIGEARIEIDHGLKMELESVIPRAVGRKTIGFEFQVSQADNAFKMFARFLEALETAEKNRLKLHGG